MPVFARFADSKAAILRQQGAPDPIRHGGGPDMLLIHDLCHAPAKHDAWKASLSSPSAAQPPLVSQILTSGGRSFGAGRQSGDESPHSKRQ